MQQINAIVDWSRIENLLIRTYPVGKSARGNEAYPPVLLMKCLLLQQWFHIDSDWTIKNDVPHFGLKEHAAVDTNYGFVLATEMTPASHHDSPYLPLCVAGSCHTTKTIKKVYADKGYFGKNNREFLHLNNIADGIMTKAVRGTELTPFEKDRNKAISQVRYIVEQYFGISHLHNNAFRARFTRLIKNAIDALFRQMAFNLLRGTKVIST